MLAIHIYVRMLLLWAIAYILKLVFPEEHCKVVEDLFFGIKHMDWK